jgi:type VI secretion system secreted protein VgrG
MDNMKTRLLRRGAFALLAAAAFFASSTQASFLGSAQGFAVMAGSTVTNTGPTVVNGNLGVWPNISVTGFPPGIVANGSMYLGDGVAQQAWNDVSAAYGALAGMSFTQDLTGQNLGGMTLTAGVYMFSSSAQLTGTITLDAQGDPNAVFIFQIGSTLTTASAASVLNINGANGCNVYWQVGSSATLGTGTNFAGNILALASITLTTGTTITDGSALALNGAVTLDSNFITACPVPGPAASMVLAAGLACGRNSRRRKQ